MVVRRLLLACLLAASLAALPAAAQQDPDLQWTDWATDPSGDAMLGPLPGADPRMDLVRLEVASDGEWLHLRLSPAGDGPAPRGLVAAADWEPSILVEGFVSGNRGGSGFQVEAAAGELAFQSGSRTLPREAYGFAPGSTPWSFHGWVALEQLVFSEDNDRLGLSAVAAEVRGATGEDRMEGSPLDLYPSANGGFTATYLPAAGTWKEVTGPDMAGGASVAAGPDGEVHVAYYVYNGTRGPETGVYHAVVGAQWEAERIGSFRPVQEAGTTQTRDAQTRTQVAVDGGGGTHVLYNPCPAQSCRPALLYGASPGWAPEDPSTGLAVDGGHRAAGEVVAAGGRVVVALPLEGDQVGIVERVDGAWSRLAVLDDARLPRLAIGPGGDLHVAFFRLVPDRHDQVDGGDLMHATESGGWDAEAIAQGIVDQSGFWNIEVDGSFAFALDPDGRPCFAWDAWLAPDDGTLERGFRCEGGAAEEAPTEPSHGNPQLAMRLAFDRDGNAHLGSGYGGTDRYAMRAPDGSWMAMDIDRHDVWDMAVTPDGVPVFAYTQPHGGTTVAVSTLDGGLAAATAGSASPASSGSARGGHAGQAPAAGGAALAEPEQVGVAVRREEAPSPVAALLAAALVALAAVARRPE